MATNDTTTSSPWGNNYKGYVAIKLYNPYPFPLTLANWQLGILDRRPLSDTYPPAGGTYPGAGGAADRLQFRAITSFTGFGVNNNTVTPNLIYPVPMVPAYGWLVLENYNPAVATPFPTPKTWDARHRPVATGLPQSGTPAIPNVNFYYIANLSDVLQDPNWTLPTASTGAIIPHSGGELVLLRPRRGDGTTVTNTSFSAASTDPNDVYDEKTNVYSTNDTTRAQSLHNLVPVDSFDFTGLQLPLLPVGTGPASGVSVPAATPTALHYVRPNPAFPGVPPPRTPSGSAFPTASILTFAPPPTPTSTR